MTVLVLDLVVVILKSSGASRKSSGSAVKAISIFYNMKTVLYMYPYNSSACSFPGWENEGESFSCIFYTYSMIAICFIHDHLYQSLNC